MRITDAVFGALVLLLLLAHGARADEYAPYVVCDDERPCRYFKTAAEMKQYVEAQNADLMAIRRKTLHRLPVDERDCGIPVLIDLMESSGALRENGARLYVTMGDGDIDLLRRQALAHQGIHVLPGSSRERDSGVTKLLNSTHHTKYWGFSVMAMSVGSMPDTFEFGAGYHCGTLCLGRLQYTVKVIGNSCSILSKQLLGVS